MKRTGHVCALMAALVCACATPTTGRVYPASRVDDWLTWGWKHDAGDAAFALWCLCVRGDNLPRDELLAREFLVVAATAGDGRSIRELAWSDVKLAAAGETSPRDGYSVLVDRAANGDAEASYYVACTRFERGEIDTEQRAALFEQVATAGSIRARRALAREWRTRPSGKLWLLDRAHERDVDCCLVLARAYETGDGMPRSLVEACRWYRMAMVGPSPEGAAGWARLYVPPPERARAGTLGGSYGPMSRLAAAGVPVAMYRQGKKLFEDPEWPEGAEYGIAFLRLAALSGESPEASKYLAAYYARTADRTPESSLRMGECAEFGWSGKPSIETAAGLYERAAGARMPEAQYVLGRLYLVHARELKLDADKAGRRALGSLESAALTWPPAQCALGLAHSQSWRVDLIHERDPASCVHWMRRAADAGHHRAQLELARCYETGYGVAASREDALTWYARAVESEDGGWQGRVVGSADGGPGVDLPEPDYLLDAPVRRDALVAWGRLMTGSTVCSATTTPVQRRHPHLCIESAAVGRHL